MAVEPIIQNQPENRIVTCSACKQPISSPYPVAHCPTCGWQEKRGAD